MTAIGAGKSGEVGVLQFSGDDAVRIFPLLVHADRAVDAVVDDDHDDRQVILDSGRELLAVHQEAAVTGEGNHGALREQ